MPQLDFLILSSQFNLIFIYILGYLFFLKYILPNITFLLKSHNKFLINKFDLFSKTSKFVNNYSFEYETTFSTISNLNWIANFYSINHYTKIVAY